METGSFEIDRSSEKNFGVVFSVVFALLGGYLSWRAGTLILWPLIVAGLLLLTAFAKPGLLYFPNLLWFKFGLLLGAIVSPVVMALVYITTVVPVGLFMRWTGKDLLHIKLNREAASYWIERETPPQPMKNQF